MANTTAEYTRLHITPFNPLILPTIIPPSILPSARNISYHNLQTFPDRAYGYVDLPVMDADKLKKKLNGSILKGTKIRIEKARPEKVVSNGREGSDPPPKQAKKSSKRKRETLPGVEILERSVKRGWTTPGTKLDKRKEKGNSSAAKSKYTDGKECLFKTVLPPNVASNVAPSNLKELKLEKRKFKKGKEAVVHEFAKTTKYATFLRSSVGGQTKGVSEFVEGKGWIDSAGNIIEVPTSNRGKSSRVLVEDVVGPAVVEPQSGESTSGDEANHTTDQSTSSEGITSKRKVTMSKISNIPNLPSKHSDTSTSGSDVDSDALSSSESSEISSEEEVEEELNAPCNSSRPSSSTLKIRIPNPTLTITPVESVHPLEALYKRPQQSPDEKVSRPTSASFSFFGAGGEDDYEEEAADKVQIPMTPFTQKDFEFRGVRSAAPTPDTAHANKRFIWPTGKAEDDEDEREASSPIRRNNSLSKADGGTAAAPESDFQKWFWENRGEATRAWKRRRKVVAKEKRQRENRERGEQTT